MKSANTKSLKTTFLIFLGFLIPLIFISWGIYLVVTVSSKQQEVTHLIETNLQIIEIDNQLFSLERALTSYRTGEFKSIVQDRWNKIYQPFTERLKKAITQSTNDGFVEIAYNLNKTQIEADKLNILFSKLIEAKDSEPDSIETDFRVSWGAAVDSTKEALKSIRSRQRANAIILVSRQKQFNYIVIISGVFSLFTFILFVLYRSGAAKRKSTEEKLQASEERFYKAFRFSPHPILISRLRDNKIIDVNEKFMDLTGYTRNEVIGNLTTDFNLWVDLDHRNQFLEMSQERGRILSFETRGRHKNGTERIILISTEIIEVEGEKCILGTIEDVTEQRRAEEALRLSEERFYKAFLANPHPMSISDMKSGVFIEVNENFALSLGYTRNELVGHSALKLDIWSKPNERQKIVEELNRSGAVADNEVNLRNKQGQVNPFLISANIVEMGGEKRMLAALIDITERKRSQMRQDLQYTVTRILSESSTVDEATFQLVRIICESLDWDMGELCHVNLQRGTLRCSSMWVCPSFESEVLALHPLSKEEIKFSPLAQYIVDKKQGVWIEETTRNPEYSHPEWAAKLGFNTMFAFPIVANGQVVTILAAFTHEKLSCDEEFVAMTTDLGRQIGQFIERKRAEAALHASEERLQQAQKMEAIGRLAGGVAHDFNNILTAITGYSDLTLRKLDADSPLNHNLTEIKKAAMRAAALTNQLLVFSRKQMMQPKTVNLNETVSHVDQMLQRLIGEDIHLLTVLEPTLSPVKTDPTQIEIALLNLAVNARDAMPNGGKMTIETANVTLDETYSQKNAGVNPGQYVMLAVSDTGHGIDEETQAHIFEPFFTTKPKGKGTGLGLSTVYGIVNQSHGHISFYTELEKGTTFKIYLPRVEDEAVPETKTNQSDFMLTGWETILLVEDEDAVRNTTREILKIFGYKVIEANDGLAALDVVANYKEKIHLVLTDVVMPRMNGSELAARLTKILPHTKLLFMSGYTDDSIIHHGVLEEGINFIEKPFMPDALAKKIREILG